MAENLKGIPINTLPEAEELDPSDQIIAYREDDGKAYRTKASIVAQMHVFCTQAEYDALPDTKYTDGVVYFIAEGGVIRNGLQYATMMAATTEEAGLMSAADKKSLWQTFANDTLLTDQAYALDTGKVYFGIIYGYGYQSQTGLPENFNYNVIVFRGYSSYVNIILIRPNANKIFINTYDGSAWTGWTTII